MKKQIFKIFLLLLPFFIPSFVDAAISVTPIVDTVLPGAERSVYSSVTGQADISVTWSASCGTLVNSVGFTTWTAPASGTCTVTGTSVADGATASATFTVSTTAIFTLNNIPMQATVYKNQPISIQSLVWGNVNTAVNWTNSGGTLIGTGREVVFSSNTAGTYTITATSQADNSKTSTTTIVVTDNEWPDVKTANNTMPIDCTATGSGTTYNVTDEATFDAVPWTTLAAGDTIRIHPGTYHKQILISRSGTASQPIRICGVRDGSGNLPIFDGTNATVAPGQSWNILRGYGGVEVYREPDDYWGGAAQRPNNIIVEGLRVTGYKSSNTYLAEGTGTPTNYVAGVACLRAQHGANVTFRGNDVSDCDNGIFTLANIPEVNMSRNFLIEGNYVYNNGLVNVAFRHQSYLQVLGLVVQGNYYGLPRAGMDGGQLKFRGPQHFIRYNYFEPAARMLDAVEAQEERAAIFTYAASVGTGYELDGLDAANLNADHVVGNEEAYQNKFIYGNILHNSGSEPTAWMVHGATDSDDQWSNPGGTLYFYNNTIFDTINSGQNYYSGLFDLGPYTGASEYDFFPTMRATNNAIYLDQSVLPGPTIFQWSRYQADRVVLDKNWVSDPASAIGSVSTLQDQRAVAWQGGRVATQISGRTNLVTGSILPFDSTSFLPIESSPLIGTSASLPGLSSALPPLMQYSPVTRLMSVRTNTQDIGALEYAGPDSTSPTTTPSPTGGTFSSAQAVTLTADESATIYYTTDGSDPTESSTQYGSPISISSTTTLKFFAKDLAGNSETIKNQTYTINIPPAETCSDSIQNQNETGIDCGGVCGACAIAPAPASPSNSSHHSHEKKTTKPRTITNSKSTIKFGQTLIQRGKKFSKKSPVLLYFSKPNGTYYPPQRILSDKSGNFLITFKNFKPKGIYSWYAVDAKTGKRSKVVKYRVK